MGDKRTRTGDSDRELDELLGRVGAELDRQLRAPATAPSRRPRAARHPLLLTSAAALLVLGGVAGVWFTTRRGPDGGAVTTQPAAELPAGHSSVSPFPATTLWPGAGTTVPGTTFAPTTLPPILTSVPGWPALATVPPTALDRCGEHVVQHGDSLASIARDNFVTLDALLAVNGFTGPDDVNLGPDTPLTLPCPMWTSVEPGADGFDDCVAATTPRTGLPYVVLSPVPAGYAPTEATRGGYGRDAEAPAALFAWADGESMIPFSLARDLDGTVKPLTIQGTIPADVLSDTIDAVTIDHTVTLDGELPAGVVLVAVQEVDVTAHSAGYQSGERSLWVQTLTDFPLDGYPDPGTTIELDVYVDGASGFVLRTPSDGPDDPGRTVLFWPDSGPFVYSIGVADADADADELVALAGTIRRATPVEAAEFVDPFAGSSWDCT